MTNLEKRCLEAEGVVFKIDYGENGSFYAQVVLADPSIGITAKALEDFGSLEKGEECICLNNKYILVRHGKTRLKNEFEFTLKSIEDKCIITEKLEKLFYSEFHGGMTECAFK